MNFDNMPVGGGMGIKSDFNIEIKVPAKKKYIENINNFKDGNDGNHQYIKSKEKQKIT